MRRRRQRIAGLVMLGWLFSQIITVAHACPALMPATQASSVGSAAAQPMPVDCETMAKQAGSNANVCKSHCVAGGQVDTPIQLPAATLASQPALTVRAADREIASIAALQALPARSAGPPPTLLFSRFLI